MVLLKEVVWDDGKAVCVGREFFVTFCVLSIYPFLYSCSRLQVTPEDRIVTVYGSKRVFPCKVSPFVGLDDNTPSHTHTHTHKLTAQFRLYTEQCAHVDN